MNQTLGFRDKTVLLVDDDLVAIQKISEQTEALGFKDVLAAHTLSEAIQHVENDKIDLALLDVNLAGCETTIELGWSLSADHIPVVFFSGYNAQDMAAVTRGHEFLEKPISIPRLKAAIHRAILRAPTLAPAMAQIKMAGQVARQ